jgi:hypothetical protein
MIPALIVGGVLLFGGGIATGVALNRDKTHKILEEQTQLIGTIQDGQRTLVEAAGKPVVIDAEVRATLAEVPPACIASLGGDPLSPQCMLQACWQYGQSAAQRPDCDAVEALVIAAQKGMSSSAGSGRRVGVGADER